MSKAVTIIGIDPGLNNTGWGIIKSDGSKLSGIACGVIKTDAKKPTPARLALIADELQTLIKKYKPDEAAVEEIFTNKNPASTQKLGLARGVALAIPAQAGLQVGEYGANLIKKCVTGYGHADKTQMTAMIKMLLPGLKLPPKADAADALAVAISHAHLRKTCGL
ncbi:MAG: crossover junction endodeoxyribonuclease RuvC [Bdellovibrionales bacterium]